MAKLPTNVTIGIGLAPAEDRKEIQIQSGVKYVRLLTGTQFGAPMIGHWRDETDPVDGREYRLHGEPFKPDPLGVAWRAVSESFRAEERDGKRFYVNGESVTFPVVASAPVRNDPLWRGEAFVRVPKPKEHPVALRDTFTFPFKGRHIAAAIGTKIDELGEKRCAIACLDSDAFKILTDGDGRFNFEAMQASALDGIDRKLTGWRTERVGYAKAHARVFELDAADVAYFGLEA